MTSNVLHIRPMMRSDIDNAVERAAAEGWNPGWHDADTLHAADAGGLLLRQIIDNGPLQRPETSRQAGPKHGERRSRL